MWSNDDERSPSAVPKLSLANGLVYVVTRDRKGSSTRGTSRALDFRTGEVVFEQRYGTGFGHNVNYAPVSLGPDGTAYVGVLGGLVRIADASADPARLPRTPPRVGAERGGDMERMLGLFVLMVAGILSLPVAAAAFDREGSENWIIPAQLGGMAVIGAIVGLAIPGLTGAESSGRRVLGAPRSAWAWRCSASSSSSCC